MTLESAVEKFLACVEKDTSSEAVLKAFLRLRKRVEGNTLLQLVERLTGEVEEDSVYARCLAFAFPTAMLHGATELEDAAEAFVAKCEGKHPEHWSAVAAIVSALDAKYAVRLLAFSSSPTFMASVVSHAEILSSSSSEVKVVLQTSLTSFLKDVSKRGIRIFFATLLGTIEEEESVGCLLEYFGQKSTSRRLMEIVKIGGSRKRKKDGTVVVSDSDEETREIIMKLVGMISRLSKALFAQYILSWNGPVDSDVWDSIVSSLFARRPSKFPIYCDRLASRCRMHSDEWWARCAHVGKIARTTDAVLCGPAWLASALNKEIVTKGTKISEALEVLSDFAVKFESAEPWKMLDVRAVCRCLQNAGTVQQLRLMSSLLDVVAFPEILAASVSKRALNSAGSLISDVDLAEFAAAFLQLQEHVFVKRGYLDEAVISRFLDYFAEWRKSRLAGQNEYVDVSLAGYLAVVEFEDRFCGLGTFLVALKNGDVRSLDEAAASSEAEWELVSGSFTDLEIEGDGVASWLAICAFVHGLRHRDDTDVKTLGTVAKFISRSSVSRKVKEIVLNEIAHEIREGGIDVFKTHVATDLVSCWRHFGPKSANFFTAIGRRPTALDVRVLQGVKSRAGFVDFLKELTSEGLEKIDTDVLLSIAEVAERETSIAALSEVFGGRRNSDHVILGDLAWIDKMYDLILSDPSKRKEGGLPVECLLNLKRVVLTDSSSSISDHPKFARLLKVFFGSEILDVGEIDRIHSLASAAKGATDLKTLSADISLVTSCSPGGSRSDVIRVKNFLGSGVGDDEITELFQRAVATLSARRAFETKYLVHEVVSVKEHETICDVVFNWLYASKERLGDDAFGIALRLVQFFSDSGRIGIHSDSGIVWRWIQMLRSKENGLRQARRLMISLMIKITQNPKDSTYHLHKVKTWLTAEKVGEMYGGTLDVTDQLLVKLIMCIDGRDFSPASNHAVDALKLKLWARVDAQDSWASRDTRHVCKNDTKAVSAVKLGPGFESWRGEVYRDGSADAYDPRVFTFTLLSMFKDVEDGYRPRYCVQAIVRLGFPAVAVACLSSRDASLRLAATACLRHLVDVVSQLPKQKIMLKIWKNFAIVVLASLAPKSDGGEHLQPRLPPASTAFLSSSCLLFNDATSHVHKKVIDFAFKHERISGCWTSFVAFPVFYNSLDVAGGPEKRSASRRFVLDVCKRAATDFATFDKDHILKIMLGSFSLRKGWDQEAAEVMSTVSAIVSKNVQKRPNILRSALDWGLAVLMENSPACPTEDDPRKPAVAGFAEVFAAILWGMWTAFLHPHLAGRDFSLESKEAATETALFVDFAVACSLVAAAVGFSDECSREKSRCLLKLRLACVIVEESLGLGIRPILSFGPASLCWERHFRALYGSGNVEGEVALERSLVVFAKNPETWENWGFDERCALEFSMFRR